MCITVTQYPPTPASLIFHPLQHPCRVMYWTGIEGGGGWGGKGGAEPAPVGLRVPGAARMILTADARRLECSYCWTMRMR